MCLETVQMQQKEGISEAGYFDSLELKNQEREIFCKIWYPSFEKHVFMHICVFQQVTILDYGCKGPRTHYEKEVFNSF